MCQNYVCVVHLISMNVGLVVFSGEICIFQEEDCNLGYCTQYDNWTNWGGCTTTCGHGLHSRSRMCAGDFNVTLPNICVFEQESCDEGVCGKFHSLQSSGTGRWCYCQQQQQQDRLSACHYNHVPVGYWLLSCWRRSTSIPVDLIWVPSIDLVKKDICSFPTRFISLIPGHRLTPYSIAISCTPAQ